MKQTEGAQAVHRAARLLKAFPPGRPERGLAELAEAAGLHRSTAHRLLAALEAEGLVERVPGGTDYRLGGEIRALGLRALGTAELRDAARAELLRLVRETGETATLEVLSGGEVLILDEVTGDHMVGSMPSAGTRWPAHATSTGKALLAHLPPSTLGALLARPLAAPTPRTITRRAALERELGRVRDRGWAASVEELEPGYVAVGAPVRDAAGAVVAAVSVGGPRARLGPARLPEIVSVLIAAAGRISARLGLRPPASAAADAREKQP